MHFYVSINYKYKSRDLPNHIERFFTSVYFALFFSWPLGAYLFSNTNLTSKWFNKKTCEIVESDFLLRQYVCKVKLASFEFQHWKKQFGIVKIVSEQKIVWNDLHFRPKWIVNSPVYYKTVFQLKTNAF